MVTISKAISAGQAQSYHKQEYTSDAQTYYKDGDKVKGEWQGQLSASFGLSGEVAPLEFSRLSEGQHPQTEVQMVKHRPGVEYTNADGTTTKEVEHRAGWDATFSAPKSVSLTALVGGDERVKEAHRAAVIIALDELERYTQARIGGNNPAETTGKFIAAKFEHDTARPVEGYAAPQLHTHAVIFNVTERADGSTRALQPQSLFDSQNFATAVYQSALTHELRKLGYELETGKSGAPEIKGYSAAYLEASSPRSQQIKEQLEKTGYSGPEAAQIAAHSTRDSKKTLTAEEVLSAHKAMAAEFGNQPEQVVAAARERAREQGRQPDGTSTAKEAVTYAKASIFEREAVADERLILRDALRRGMGETTYAQVRGEFDSRQKQGEFLSREGGKYDTGRSFTTPETIAHERANVRHVLEGRNAVEPIMSAENAQAQANTRDFLNPKQKAVIEEVLNSSDRVHGLQGLAGTGKTTALAAIREGAEKSGYTVEGFAPSSKAAGALRDAGVEAKTLQSFLASKQADPETRHLYMLDESSLASSKQMRGFLEKIGPNDRVLVIGDTRQHQAVDAGRPFEQMQDAGMRTAQLARPDRAVVLAADPAERKELTQLIRTDLHAQGRLADESRSVPVLVERELTNPKLASQYALGDQIHYKVGSPEQHGIASGSTATVLKVDRLQNLLTVETGNGESIAYRPHELKRVTGSSSVYRQETRELAVGERIQLTQADKSQGIRSGDFATVERIADNNALTVRMDKGKTVELSPEKAQHIEYGYAVEGSKRIQADRILATGETLDQKTLASIPSSVRDLSVYTSDGSSLQKQKQESVPKEISIPEVQQPERQYRGFGLSR